MPIIDYYITDAKGRFKPIHQRVDVIPKTLSLPASYSYMVGIDQSTTCTGIYIQDVGDNINFICDFQRIESVGEYTEKLILFLKKLLKDRKLELFVYEALPTGAVPNHVLEGLHSTISKLRETDPVFKWMPQRAFDDIPPSMWKSHVYKKEQHGLNSSAFNTKREIAKDIVVRKPHLQPFLEVIKSKDYDAFDACGILLGYLEEHYVDGVYGKQNRRIGGQTKFFNDVFIACSTVQARNIELMKEDLSYMFENWIKEEDIPLLKWNSEDSFLENVRKSLSYEDRILTLVDDPRVELSLKLRYGLKLNKGEKIVLFVGKSKSLTQSEKSVLKKGGRFKCELFK